MPSRRKGKWTAYYRLPNHRRPGRWTSISLGTYDSYEEARIMEINAKIDDLEDERASLVRALEHQGRPVQGLTDRQERHRGADDRTPSERT